jgi:hypothetical protein
LRKSLNKKYLKKSSLDSNQTLTLLLNPFSYVANNTNNRESLRLQEMAADLVVHQQSGVARRKEALIDRVPSDIKYFSLTNKGERI